MIVKGYNFFKEVKKNKVIDLIGIKEILEDRIILKDGTQKRIVIFNTLNPLTSTEHEQMQMVDRLNKAVISFNEKMMIRSLNLNLDLSNNLDFWKKELDKGKHTNFEMGVIKNIIHNISTADDNEEIPNKVFLFIYEIKQTKDFKNKEDNFLAMINTKAHSEIVRGNLLKVLLFKDFNFFDKNAKFVENKKIIHSKYTRSTNDTTEEVLTKITPNAFTFLPDHIKVNEKRLSIYGLVGGKEVIDFGDFLKISNNKNIDIAIIIDNISIQSDVLNKQIDKADVNIEHAIEDKKSTNEINKIVEQREMIKVAKEQVDKNGEKIVSSNIFFRFYSDGDNYKNDFKANKSQVESLGYQIQNISNFQKEAYTQTSLSFKNTKVFEDGDFDLAMSTGSLINFYPFINRVETNSNEAIPFVWSRGNVISFDSLNDPAKLNAPNNNLILLGQSGKGKTTLIKKLLYPEIIKGAKVFIIDPESEFSQSAKDLSGKVIKANSELINPLQPKVLEFIDDNDKLIKVTIKSYIPNVIAFLEALNPGFDKNLMIKILEDTYKSKGIENNTDLSKLKAKDYPIFDDVFKTIFLYLFSEKDFKNYTTSDNKNIFDYEIKTKSTEATKYELEKTLMFMQRLGSDGTYGEYFNGYTTLSLDSKEKLYVFDLYNVLMTKDNNLISAVYFNILSFIEFGATLDKNEKCIVVADEAHLMLKNKLHFVVEYLESFSKRLRKNSSCQWLATQDLKDFTANEIKDSASKILSNAPIKIIMGLEQNQSQELSQIYKNLTPTEINLIETADKGEGVMMISDNKIPFEVIYNKSELDLISYNPEQMELKKVVKKAEELNVDISDVFRGNKTKTEQIEAIKKLIGGNGDVVYLRERVKELEEINKLLTSTENITKETNEIDLNILKLVKNIDIEEEMDMEILEEGKKEESFEIEELDLEILEEDKKEVVLEI